MLPYASKWSIDATTAVAKILCSAMSFGLSIDLFGARILDRFLRCASGSLLTLMLWSRYDDSEVNDEDESEEEEEEEDEEEAPEGKIHPNSTTMDPH